MFEPTLYPQGQFTLNFPRYAQIRRMANQFEDFFRDQFQGHYGQPKVVPVPDELDAEVPRLVFDSRHGFSQVIVTQISILLQVTFSPDWQLDIALGHDYLMERVPALFALHGMLEGSRINFSGVNVRARLPVRGDEEQLLPVFHRASLRHPLPGVVHDLSVRTSQVIDDRYFSNVTVQNYRAYSPTLPTQGVPRMSRRASASKGLEIIVDYNDRYAYNERQDYFSDERAARDIIGRGVAVAAARVDELRALGQ